MAVLLRRLVACLACVTLAAGAAAVRPCADEDQCADACAGAAVACPGSGQHHDPDPPFHWCACMCHVPAAILAPAAPPTGDVPAGVTGWCAAAPLAAGFAEAPFRPPRG